jgi:hypothetical protein
MCRIIEQLIKEEWVAAHPGKGIEVDMYGKNLPGSTKILAIFGCYDVKDAHGDPKSAPLLALCPLPDETNQNAENYADLLANTWEYYQFPAESLDFICADNCNTMLALGMKSISALKLMNYINVWRFVIVQLKISTCIMLVVPYIGWIWAWTNFMKKSVENLTNC